MIVKPTALLLNGLITAGIALSGCSTAPETALAETAANQDETYVTVEAAVGSRIKKRVKASELHKLREPGKQVVSSQEEQQNLSSYDSGGFRPAGGDGTP